jgi:flagellin
MGLIVRVRAADGINRAMNTINSTMMTLIARHSLARSQAALATAMERLATGTRLNRASVDPAGMIAAERLESRNYALERMIDRLDFDNNRLAAKDGALSVLGDMATELEGLVVAAANTGAMSDVEREALQIEADSIVQGMNHVVNTSTFNGEKLLGGFEASSLGSVHGTVTEGGETLTTTFTLADLVSGGKLDLVSGDLSLAQEVASKAASRIATARGAVGNLMLENESRMRSSMAELESSSAALSAIRDTDYYAETASLMRARVLEQAGVATLLIGFQHQERVLGLLAA